MYMYTHLPVLTYCTFFVKSDVYICIDALIASLYVVVMNSINSCGFILRVIEWGLFLTRN